MKLCENCLEPTDHVFLMECEDCQGDMQVCRECVNRRPRHQEGCPDLDTF